MDTRNRSKLNKLLAKMPPGVVVSQAWLDTLEISRDLARRYVEYEWLERIARGTYIRANEQATWQGALHCVQNQLGLNIHAGAYTSLEHFGVGHYMALDKPRITLFGLTNTKLPVWFSKADLQASVSYHPTNLFDNEATIGVTYETSNGFGIQISTPERAILELIYLSTKDKNFEDPQLAMESLSTLRPKLMQELLERCTHIKVKRFFMVLAEYNNHQWASKIDLSNVNFGKGKRQLVEGGRFNKKYNMTVPTYYG